VSSGVSRVYLDHNATTPLREEARAAWLAAHDGLGGNPSSLHRSGRRARDLAERARARVAAALGVHEDEVIFTSGGTESNNLALAGGLAGHGGAGGEAALVTSAVEHSSVLETARALERAGHPLVLIPVDREGLPDPGALSRAVARPEVGLLSLQAANNEIGSTPDLAAAAECLRARGAERPLFHSDAVQALGRLPLRLDDWGVDLASFSAHKVGGPTGIGVLVRRRGVPLAPLFHGGAQEGGLRPGTEDVAGIAAAAVAIELAVSEQESFAGRARELALFLWRELASKLPGVRLHGPGIERARRLPNTLNLGVAGADGRVLVTRLDLAGLAISAGSACASGSLEPSHVLLALGLSLDDARAGLRLSLGRTSTRDDCVLAVDALCKLARTSRASR
jgi:cysteine desulfurase